jgi:cytochrome c-type biogenesis protein CcmF
MTAEIGQFSLILAFVLAVAQSLVPLIGAAREDPALMAFGRMSAGLQAVLVALSFACLAMLFMGLDFSVKVVADNAHSTQPMIYRFAGTWGNHEGSLLLWILILAVFGAAVALFGGNLRESLQARVLAVQGMIGAAFLAFAIFTSNPFARLDPAPLDGRELNPLLQDPGLALHPPLLYLGYVGFSVAFSFAVAALIEGRVDAAWARWVRPWVLAAWACLTAGIALGSFWAYYELGWGGWWFWDPVENASFMPWLLGTALLHSALVLERRNALISWTILLGILTFSLSLIGTFLVRSGILTSVHAFAVDAERGVFILAMIVVATGGALGLFAWRAPAMRSGAIFAPLSREGGLTMNNLLLMAATATVFLGTFYPVIVDALSGDKISVGPPYYNAVFVPVMIPLLVLVTVGPMLNWKRDEGRALALRLRWPAAIAGAALVLGFAVLGLGRTLAVTGFALGVWLIAGALWILVRRWRLGEARGEALGRLVRTTPRSVYGMILAHAGLGVMVCGITAMSGWESSRVLAMRPGQSETIGPARVTLESLRHVDGPNYSAEQARFAVARGGKVDVLVSEKRSYPISQSQTTEAGIGNGALGNVYVAIGDAEQDGGRVVRLYYHPLVNWIWFGALFMTVGGLVSLTDRRFRVGAPVRHRLGGRDPKAAAV